MECIATPGFRQWRNAALFGRASWGTSRCGLGLGVLGCFALLTLLSACQPPPTTTTTTTAPASTTTAPASTTSTAAGDSRPVTCSAPDPHVADPTGPHGLFVNAANSPQSLADSEDLMKYVATDSTVCGANIIVPWSAIDKGPNATPRYDWSFLDQAVQPWEAAGKTVNLIVWGVAEQTTQQWGGEPVTPPYVLSQVDTVQCTPSTPPTPVYWEPAYQQNWQAFVSAVVAHVTGDPHVGYLRFGIGTGGENYVENDLQGSCLNRWNAYGYQQKFPAYTTTMLDYEASLHSVKPILVGINQFNGANGMADQVAGAAASDGFGFGTQGLSADAISEAGSGQSCYADWCALFQKYQGKVPLEVQTYEKSNPDGSGPVGTLPPLLTFGLNEHAQIFELYPSEWLVADDPSWPGYIQAHASYAQALSAAASVVG